MIHTVQQDILMPTALDGFLTKLTDVSTTNHTFFSITMHKEKNVLLVLMFIIWSPTIFGSLSYSLSLSNTSTHTNLSLIFTVNWTRWFVHILTNTYIYGVGLSSFNNLCSHVKDSLFLRNTWSLIFLNLFSLYCYHT